MDYHWNIDHYRYFCRCAQFHALVFARRRLFAIVRGATATSDTNEIISSNNYGLFLDLIVDFCCWENDATGGLERTRFEHDFPAPIERKMFAYSERLVKTGWFFIGIVFANVYKTRVPVMFQRDRWTIHVRKCSTDGRAGKKRCRMQLHSRRVRITWWDSIRKVSSVIKILKMHSCTNTGINGTNILCMSSNNFFFSITFGVKLTNFVSRDSPYSYERIKQCFFYNV